jgi:hypothetical protein
VFQLSNVDEELLVTNDKIDTYYTSAACTTTTAATETTTTTETYTTATTATDTTATQTSTTQLQADCSAGDFKRLVCEAITGPNGGIGACKYKRLTNECITNKKFVDDTTTTTVTGTSITSVTTTTELSCVGSLFQGPLLGTKGQDQFTLLKRSGVTVDQCAAVCKLTAQCVGFSHRVGDNIPLSLNIAPVCHPPPPLPPSPAWQIQLDTVVNKFAK